jgi:hypothetical protein
LLPDDTFLDIANRLVHWLIIVDESIDDIPYVPSLLRRFARLEKLEDAGQKQTLEQLFAMADTLRDIEDQAEVNDVDDDAIENQINTLDLARQCLRHLPLAGQMPMFEMIRKALLKSRAHAAAGAAAGTLVRLCRTTLDFDLDEAQRVDACKAIIETIGSGIKLPEMLLLISFVDSHLKRLPMELAVDLQQALINELERQGQPPPDGAARQDSPR